MDNRFLFRAALTFSYVTFPDFCGALGGYAVGQQYSGGVRTSRSAQCANHPQWILRELVRIYFASYTKTRGFSLVSSCIKEFDAFCDGFGYAGLDRSQLRACAWGALALPVDHRQRRERGSETSREVLVATFRSGGCSQPTAECAPPSSWPTAEWTRTSHRVVECIHRRWSRLLLPASSLRSSPG